MRSFCIGILLLLFALLHLQAQQCNGSLSGQVVDRQTGKHLPFATVSWDSSSHAGHICNDKGCFHIQGLCLGEEHHICISQMGFEEKCFHITVEQTKKRLIFELDGEELEVEEVEITTLQEPTTIGNEIISNAAIAAQANGSLGDQLSNIAGVEVLRTGATIDKPIIHGLYGNRIAILNNGVAQAGQQWGNDHAPEIDPMVARQIKVIKGVGSLAYMSSSLGALVLVEPGKILKKDGLHGQYNYLLQTNGWGHTSNIQLEKHNKILPWRITTSFKRMGDLRTARYYLSNTGLYEANFALQVAKSFKNKWITKGYYSLFSGKTGVLRGAHIGNLTDLELALTRTVPFFTKSNFSYQINYPHQKVVHHLLKLGTDYFSSDRAFWTFNYALQVNHRKEFDVRRGGRSSTPALNLQKTTHFTEALYQYNWHSYGSLKTGLQGRFIDNYNIPGTGFLPLLPNFYQYDAAIFAILNQRLKKLQYHIALRASSHLMDVQYITRLRQQVNYHHFFQNWNAAATLDYQIHPRSGINFNIGYVERYPSLSELYSFGLHQGVGGIEEGDPNLKKEKSLKSTFTFQWHKERKLNIQLLSYVQHIKNYIYLQPQKELRLTVRGAFPVFVYQQTDAFLCGGDVVFNYNPAPYLFIQGTYSYLKGKDLLQSLSIINLPSNRIKGKIEYSVNSKKLATTAIELNGQHVFQQKALDKAQDFVSPPPAYFLLGAMLSTNFQMRTFKFKSFIKVENLLNRAYRDYLNRQRYFADDVGVNIIAGFNLSF